MRRLNSIVKIRIGILVVLALLVYQVLEPRVRLSDAKSLLRVQGSSVAYYKQGDHRKGESQNKGSKKPTQILRNHQPEKLVEKRQVVSAQTEFYIQVDHSACEQLEPEETLALRFFVLCSIPAKRAPPRMSSL